MQKMLTLSTSTLLRVSESSVDGCGEVKRSYFSICSSSCSCVCVCLGLFAAHRERGFGEVHHHHHQSSLSSLSSVSLQSTKFPAVDQ